jgi:L-fucose mutarotase
MLKGIHPLLGPDLLHALRAMGHGDDIVIADANFPASSLGPKVIRADGVDAIAMTEAILTHMPLDTFAPESAWRMQVVDDPEAVPPVCVEFQDVVTRLAGSFTVHSVERFAFYDMARRAACIVATTEFRLYGNIILRKGVVHPHEVFRGSS